MRKAAVSTVSRYRVLVRGERVRVEMEGNVREAVVFATRVVSASEPGAAGRKAVTEAERELAGRLLNGPADGLPHFSVDETEQVPWWWRRFNPPAGFTWSIWNSGEPPST